MDSEYKPVWINMNTILCAWKLRKDSKWETMTISQKHIDIAKDNLARLVATENDVIIDMKRKIEMEQYNVDWK